MGSPAESPLAVDVTEFHTGADRLKGIPIRSVRESALRNKSA